MKRVANNAIDRLNDALDRFDAAVDEYDVMTDKLRDSASRAAAAGDDDAVRVFTKSDDFLADSLNEALDTYMKRYYTSKY